MSVAEFFTDYGLFLIKIITVVIAILVLFGGIFAGKGKDKQERGRVDVRFLNKRLGRYKEALQESILDEDALKKLEKANKAEAKQEKKARKAADKSGSEEDERKKRVYVLNFDGDIKASAVENMREEITSVLTLAEAQDEVVLKLESGGGMVHSYGLAASQLQRIKDKGIPLTICVDKVAASGGYMMACVADKVLAAPFAILGSIGVVAQIPNFHKILKKNDIDYELITAGEHKRTLTMFGENTDKGREKFREDIEDTHELFKDFVRENRDCIDIDEVATGDVWFGRRAMEHKLADELKTSDEYLTELCDSADVYEVSFTEKKSIQDKFGLAAQNAMENVLTRVWEKARFPKNFL